MVQQFQIFFVSVPSNLPGMLVLWSKDFELLIE